MTAHALHLQNDQFLFTFNLIMCYTHQHQAWRKYAARISAYFVIAANPHIFCKPDQHYKCEVLPYGCLSYLDFRCMRFALVIFMYEFNQEKKYNSQFVV